jgi:hypothetical protein
MSDFEAKDLTLMPYKETTHLHPFPCPENIDLDPINSTEKNTDGALYPSITSHTATPFIRAQPFQPPRHLQIPKKTTLSFTDFMSLDFPDLAHIPSDPNYAYIFAFDPVLRQPRGGAEV